MTSINIYARNHQILISIGAIKWLYFLHSMMKRGFRGKGFPNQYEILFCLSGKCSVITNTKILPCYRRMQWLGSIQISLKEFCIAIYLLPLAVILPIVAHLGFMGRLKRYFDRPFWFIWLIYVVLLDVLFGFIIYYWFLKRVRKFLLNLKNQRRKLHRY